MAQESIADRLVRQLREMVLTGGLAPGSVIVEPQLAEQFGVSKTPVREALRLLATEGLVAVVPKKGYLVRMLGPQDVSEVLDLRMLLEPHAAGAAARFADASLASELRAVLDRQSEVAGADPLAGMQEARLFHQGIAHAARNRRLAETLQRCFDESARAHHVLPGLRQHMTARQELEEHEAVFAAIAAGDPVQAAEAMRAHLRTIHDTAMRQVAHGSGLWD
jgi:DNA-binding GntR family transcriptional regulator